MNTPEDIARYGFQWGQVAVTRTAEIDGRRIVTIETPFRRMNVYASPTGRSLRVFRDGKELT